MNWAAVDVSLLAPAFVAGLLVLATHVPLGQQVLARGIVFIDLAIAQIAGLGVIVAQSLWHEPSAALTQAAAFGAAVLGALVLTLTERKWPLTQEALIGVSFVLAACLGLVVLAGNPHGGEHLKDLLVGQILWVDMRDLGLTAGLSVLVLALWFGLGARLPRSGFYLLFALAITASVQRVGVYLVFASLILPALATLGNKRPLLAGYGLGVAAYASGLLLAALLDLPPGPVIVLSMAALAILARPVLRRM